VRASNWPSDTRPGSGSGMTSPNPGISSLITVSIGHVNAGCGEPISTSQVSSLASDRVPGRSGYQLTASGPSPAEARYIVNASESLTRSPTDTGVPARTIRSVLPCSDMRLFSTLPALS